LKTLRAKGFIALEMDEFDNRLKYVVSTPISTEYFLKLGQSLQDAGLETAAPKTRAKLKK
jgi:DNA-binding MarR family transcriptional regulator